MNPFFRAREEALKLRGQLVGGRATGPVAAKDLLAKVETKLQLAIEPVAHTSSALKGAYATLDRHESFIYVRKEVSPEERAYLIAHELGHLQLDSIAVPKQVHVNSTGLPPSSHATALVEAYGARERAELQKNVFGREFLLPRAVARDMFNSGMGPNAIAAQLGIPVEVARQQVLDAILLPAYMPPPPADLPVPTADQQEAIDACEKCVHVVAGPGTGKTTTLIHRVKKLIEKDGVAPEKILVLTFTNKAASELVDRLQRAGVVGASEIWAGTFHAVGLEFLRKYYQHFAVTPSVAVADTLTQLTITAKALASTPLKHYKRTDDPYEWLPPVIKVALRLKEELVTPAHYLKEAKKTALNEEQRAQFEDVAAVAKAYASALAQAGMVDFVDLVARPATAVKQDRAKFSEVADRYDYILVDEFQDLTTAMIELVEQVAKNAQSLWVVGDIRQAIYHWRGASIQGLLGFEKRFTKSKRYDLVRNRRSFKEITDLTAEVGMAHELQKSQQLVMPKATRGASGTLPVMWSGAGRAEMLNVLSEDIESAVRDGSSYKNHAVLARNSSMVAAAATALKEKGIPTLYVGDLLERAEIKDLLCVIQLIVERSPRAMLRVGELTQPKMPLKDIQALMTAVAQDQSLQRMGWLTGTQLLSVAGEKSRIDLRSKLHGFYWGTSPWDFICEMLLEKRFLIANLNDVSIDGHLRRLAVWQFAYVTRTGDGDRKRSTLSRFLNRLRLRNQVGDIYVDRELPPETGELNGVRVMTIHSSKGLEFQSVHLCGVHGEHFDGGKSSNELLPPSCIHSSPQMHDEETRIECNNLLYVAVSRAKDALTIYQNTKAFPPDFELTPALERARKSGALRQQSFASAPRPASAQKKAIASTACLKVDYEEYVTYDRCARQYLYRYGMELGRELPPNPSLRARGLVMTTLETAAKDGLLASASEIFAKEWEGSQLPPPEVDAQLWDQSLLACENGAKYLAGLRGTYASPTAELPNISIALP